MLHITTQGTYLCTNIVAQMVLCILTMFDGQCSIRFYFIPFKTKFWSWPFKLISWPTKLISWPTNVSWPAGWKTLAWPYSNFPFPSQRLREEKVSVDNSETRGWETEIKMRRKGERWQKRKSGKRKNGNEMRRKKWMGNGSHNEKRLALDW
jgi:hypothetical protein